MLRQKALSPVGVGLVSCVEHRGESRIYQGVGWYPRVTESMGHVPLLLQFENWNLIENHFARNTGSATK